MIAPWLLYAALVGVLFGLAALGFGRLAQLSRLPTRGIWLGAVVLSVLAPIIGNLVASPAAGAGGSGVASLTPASRSMDTTLLMLWGAASLLMTARLIAMTVLLRRRRRNWRETAIDGTPVLLTTEVGPALMGLTNPRPVIPAWALSLGANERTLMLLHEAEHARASDPWLLAVGTASVAAMPWNPAIWWLVRRLRLAVEIDCDARVLRSGADPRAYASLLLAVGERMSRTRFAWATALAEPRSQLERRILVMTSPSKPRRLFATAGLVLAAGAAIIVACEAPLPDQVAPGAIQARQEGGAPVTISDQARLGDTVGSLIVVQGVPVHRSGSRIMLDNHQEASAGQALRGTLLPVKADLRTVTGQRIVYTTVLDSVPRIERRP